MTVIQNNNLYNLEGSIINCHHSEPNGPRSIEKIIDGIHGNYWSTEKTCKDMAGWIHIKFKKPLIINGFGLTKGNNPDCHVKNFRLYGKVINKKEDLLT